MGCIWKLCLFSAEEIPTKIKENRISKQRIRTAMVKNGSQMGEEYLSGRVRMFKWTRELMKNYKPQTPKQLERLKIREQKIMKELYESDFHEITWDKKCV